MAEKAENRNNLWDNPDPEVPIATAHLYSRNQPSGDENDSDEALITLEHLNCQFTTIEKVSGAHQHGGINQHKLDQILSRPEKKLYINPATLFSAKQGLRRTITAFESDSDYQEDEQLRQELEMIMLDEMESKSYYSEISSVIR